MLWRTNTNQYHLINSRLTLVNCAFYLRAMKNKLHLFSTVLAKLRPHIMRILVSVVPMYCVYNMFTPCVYCVRCDCKWRVISGVD